jgi:hypothetical protein
LKTGNYSTLILVAAMLLALAGSFFLGRGSTNDGTDERIKELENLVKEETKKSESWKDSVELTRVELVVARSKVDSLGKLKDKVRVRYRWLIKEIEYESPKDTGIVAANRIAEPFARVFERINNSFESTP